jgi:hypothetical protein
LAQLRFCFVAELADASGNALEGAAWPSEIDLTQWPVHTLSIFSPPRLVGSDTDFVGPMFSLRAEITGWHSELRPIPEPGAFGIFGLGLALVARRRLASSLVAPSRRVLVWLLMRRNRSVDH